MKVIVATAVLVGSISAASAQQTLETYRRKAMARDYDAQRETASCLSTGKCVGSPVPNAIEACAERMVILGSGHGNVDASDISNFRQECISSLSNQERATALAQAEQLFKEIYKRELPMKTLLQ